MDGALTLLALGAVIFLISAFEAGLWADEGRDGVPRDSVEWGQKAGRQVVGRICRRYGMPLGAVLLGLGLVVTVVTALGS